MLLAFYIINSNVCNQNVLDSYERSIRTRLNKKFTQVGNTVGSMYITIWKWTVTRAAAYACTHTSTHPKPIACHRYYVWFFCSYAIYIYRCVNVCVYPRFKVKFCFHNILSISARAFFYLVFARVSPFRPSACLCFVCLFRVYAELCIYWAVHEYTCLALKIIIKKKEREQTSEKKKRLWGWVINKKRIFEWN